jgi:trimeric autotransporter adhesin
MLDLPYDVAVDSTGNLFIADTNNKRIRKVSPAGVIATVAGNGIRGSSDDRNNGKTATSVPLYFPLGIAVDSEGNLYICETSQGLIRKVTSVGVISTIAGNGTHGYSGDGGQATLAQLYLPRAIAVDSTGNLFIADTDNHRIRKVTLDGVITTIVGNGTAGYSGDDGRATSAQLSRPSDVAVDSAGNLYIADTVNNRIRKVTPAGVITTIAGNGMSGSSGDGGPAASARLIHPSGVTIDSAGNLYIVGENMCRIRKVSLDGLITTVAGGNGFSAGFSGDGGLAVSAQLAGPQAVAVDSAGNLYIADTGNNRIRRVSPSSQ